MDRVKYLEMDHLRYETELIGYKSMNNWDGYDLETWKECRNSFGRWV
jgi:hypothetical protein